jgi:hypothetical protein
MAAQAAASMLMQDWDILHPERVEGRTTAMQVQSPAVSRPV